MSGVSILMGPGRKQPDSFIKEFYQLLPNSLPSIYFTKDVGRIFLFPNSKISLHYQMDFCIEVLLCTRRFGYLETQFAPKSKDKLAF